MATPIGGEACTSGQRSCVNSDRVDQGARAAGVSKHNHGLLPSYNSVAKWE